MGTFEGHVIPSVIYSLLALWWSFVTSIRYIRTQKNEKNQFIGSTAMPCFFLPNRKLRLFPTESLFKLVFLSIHVFFEIYVGLRWSTDSKKWVLPNENAHHICMISGFIFGAIVEILIYYGVPFPKKTEFFINLLAFLIQALLMTQHLDGDAGLEHHVHKLWTIVIVFSFVTCCLEVYKPNTFWIVYLRSFFLLVQGTWMMQIAFVIWPKTDNPFWHWGMDMTSHTWLSISLMYHFIGCAVILLIQYLCIYVLFNLFDKYYQVYLDDLDIKQQLELKGYNSTDSKAFLYKEHALLMNEEDEL